MKKLLFLVLSITGAGSILASDAAATKPDIFDESKLIGFEVPPTPAQLALEAKVAALTTSDEMKHAMDDVRDFMLVFCEFVLGKQMRAFGPWALFARFEEYTALPHFSVIKAHSSFERWLEHFKGALTSTVKDPLKDA